MKYLLNLVCCFITIFLLYSCTSKNVKYGYEYLNDSIYEGDFCFWNKDLTNNVQVQEGILRNCDNRKYFNHILFCLDTISNFKIFVCTSANFFEGNLSVAWGQFHPNCEFNSKDSVSKEKFETLKYNTIHGASLIVNSCLFDKRFSKKEDVFYLYYKYYSTEEYLNDSIMNMMHEDIKWLCKKGEDDK